MELVQVISQKRSQKLIADFLIVLSTSLLFGLSSWIAIRFPFSPIPISFTAHLILMFSVLLGKRGAYATWLYLIQGALGFPVFSNGGSGLAYILGPTGGYLVGFAIASYVVAILSTELKEKSPSKIFGILLLGNALIYVFGLPHLGVLVGTANAFKLGFIPFIGGDLLKLIFANRSLKFLKYFD